ncbi:MAG: sodium:calcium antiporter, partial [Alistipes sp.]|nr:sodium:calcium antiporter [Alistipes sp.]
MNIVLLLAGLGLILAGAHFLTDGAAALAQRFRVPEFIVGLTVVAIGTSTPELVVSVLSSIARNSDVAVGNVVGSNLFNVLVIVGVCALIRPLAFSRDNIRRDIPFGLGASLLLFLFASDKLLHLGSVDRIDRADGIVMLVLYVGLLVYTLRTAGRTPVQPSARPAKAWWLMIGM